MQLVRKGKITRAMLTLDTPGQYEFARKGDPPVMGITKLGGAVTKEGLMRPRKPVEVPSLLATASRLPSGSDMQTPQTP